MEKCSLSLHRDVPMTFQVKTAYGDPCFDRPCISYLRVGSCCCGHLSSTGTVPRFLRRRIVAKVRWTPRRGSIRCSCPSSYHSANNSENEPEETNSDNDRRRRLCADRCPCVGSDPSGRFAKCSPCRHCLKQQVKNFAIVTVFVKIS